MDSFAAATTGLILGLFFGVAIGLPEAAPFFAIGGGVTGFMLVSRLKMR